MEVQHLLTAEFIKVKPNTTARETLSLFLEHQQDLACVMEENKLIGIVTKYSLYRLLLKNDSLDTEINSVIIKDVVVLQKNESVYEAKNILVKHRIGHAVVLNTENEVVGVMTKSDLINGLIKRSENLVHRLKSLMNHLQESVIAVDLQLKITSINNKAMTLFNVTEDEILHQPVSDVFPDLAQELKQTINTREGIDSKRIDLHNTTTFSSFFPINEWGKVNGAMVVLKDVTDFEKIATELESTKRIEKILDSALEAAYDAVVITDNDGNVTKANATFLTLFGYPTIEDILGKSINRLTPALPIQQTPSATHRPDAKLIEINERKAIFNQMPIIQNNKKIGDIYKIIYEQLDVWKDLLQHMDRLESELSFYRRELKRISAKSDPFFSFVSKSDKIKHIKKEAHIAAKSFANVLLTGESGTGKELIADGIHRASGRTGAFIKINCAAFPENLLESEFFGYADGAFTGARKGGKPGKFELAHRGTLFLDEIGDMPQSLQAKLLRVLQEKEFERIGDTETIKVDVRIITATNKDLLKLVQEGHFREDLYYRVHVINLHLPPLRERPDDIPILVEHFLQKLKMKTDKDVVGLMPEAIQKLQSYHWPGNVRQLENIIERSFHFTNDRWIDSQSILLDSDWNEGNSLNFESQLTTVGNRQSILDEADKNMLLQALEHSNGNRTAAAKLLGISRSTLYQKLKKYDIQSREKWY